MIGTDGGFRVARSLPVDRLDPAPRPRAHFCRAARTGSARRAGPAGNAIEQRALAGVLHRTRPVGKAAGLDRGRIELHADVVDVVVGAARPGARSGGRRGAGVVAEAADDDMVLPTGGDDHSADEGPVGGIGEWNVRRTLDL